MRNRMPWIGFLATVALALAIAAPAAAAAPNATVAGGGIAFSDADPEGMAVIGLAAREDSDGVDSGQVTFAQSRFGHFRGRIDCVSVVDNRATLSGTIIDPAQGVFANGEDRRGFIMWIEDNGPPAGGTPTDRIQIGLFTDPQPACFPAFLLGTPVETGNYVINS